MTKKKNHYYVLVFTSTGPVYVTKILPHDVAQWLRTEKPMELSKSDAEFLPIGLGLNGTSAVTVVMPYELEIQPYYYKTGKFEWKEEQNDEH